MTEPKDLVATAKAVTKIVSVGPLRTAQDAAQASELLVTLHRVHAEGEEARKARKAPHLAAGRAVDALFQPALKELQSVILMVKARISERKLAQDEARAKAIAAPPEEANAILAELPDETHKGISERWTWEVESVDLPKVPREFLILDDRKVRGVIRDATKEARQPRIPGVTFARKVQIVASR